METIEIRYESIRNTLAHSDSNFEIFNTEFCYFNAVSKQFMRTMDLKSMDIRRSCVTTGYPGCSTMYCSMRLDFTDEYLIPTVFD